MSSFWKIDIFSHTLFIFCSIVFRIIFNYSIFMPVILHIDFDSYFASCEQQFNASLRGKPIGVTATNGRTCIIAASREAKKLGIKSPSRTWEAIKIVPSMIYVPAQFDRYWEITQKFLDICKDYSPSVELFSLDEVFIDITKTEHLFGDRYKLIQTIKKRIREEIGEYITVSVGLSYNKLLAKLGSGLNKPDGFTEIWPEDVEKIYSQIELTALCGIGERVKRRLNKIGIYTPLDLRNASIEKLILEFKDAEGHFLKRLGVAEDNSTVVPYYHAEETKSVGRNYCLPQNTYNKRKILQHIYELSEEVGIKLRRLNKKGRTVGLWLGGNKPMHGRKTVKSHIDQGHEIYALCKTMYDEWDWGNRDSEDGMVRQLSIWIGNLEDSKNLTLSLFDFEPKKGKALEAADKINDKFGDHTIRKGFLVDGPNLKTVPNGWMADRYERSKLVGSVS
jgi:DNA polymerase-4